MPGCVPSTLDERLERARGFLDGVLADPPRTLLDLKRRLASELDCEVRPEALQALASMAELTDPVGKEIATTAAATHLAMEFLSREVWESAPLDPAALRRAGESIPAMIVHHRDAEIAYREAIGSVDLLHRGAVAKLHADLRQPEEPAFAALVVIPEVARLAAAVRDGSLGQFAPSLSPEETEAWTAAAADPLEAASCPPRSFLDAVALRTLMERDLTTWRTLPPPGEADEAGTEAREALRRRLEMERAAHPVVSPRLDALRARRFERTLISTRHLDDTRRRLFATYLDLSKALAGGTTETGDEMQSRILEAEIEAAEVDAERESRHDLMRTAAAGADTPRREVVLPPDVRDLVRERRRKRVLLGIAAALVPVAVAANLLLYPKQGKSPVPSPEMFASAMPVQQAAPIGRTLFSQVSTFLWDGMDDSERRRRVAELSRIAAGEGYNVVLVVDESRVERARWTATGGVEIVQSAPAP